MTTHKRSGNRIDWHAGFAGGLEISLKDYAGHIDIEREHLLTKDSPRIDFLVIKKDVATVINNAIGRGFRKYNIVEYKNPNDALNIDVVWKSIGYAALYKGLAKKVNEIPEEELTVTILRTRYPSRLFASLRKKGRLIDNPFPGVYVLPDMFPIPLQIIVTKDLAEDVFRGLRILTPDADKKEVRQFLQESSDLDAVGLGESARAILHASAAANRLLYDEIRKEPTMKNFWDEIEEEAMEKGRDESLLTSIKNLMETMKLSSTEAMKALKIPAKDQKRYAAML